MTISQVALSNTFNEFRQTFNDVANTTNALTDIDTTRVPVYASTLTATAVSSANVSAANVNVSTLTSGRVVLAGTSGVLQDDSGLTFNTSTNVLTTTGGVTTATLNATGNTTLGSGANNAVYYPANGSLILTSSGDASGTGRIQSNHIHADWHVGAGGDLETWATAKNDNADTHHVFAVANTNAPIDMMVVNQNEGNAAYAEFIAIHSTGNTTDGWVSTGVNSSNYADGAFGVTKADDAYLLYSAPVGTTRSGDLVIGTSGNGTGNKIIFCANGFDDPANNTQLTINPAQSVSIAIATESSNTTTGALVVNGGIGLRGNLNVGGNVAITGTITLGGGGNTVSTSSLQVDNPTIFLASNNAADILDVGIVGQYTASGTKYNGFTRDASDSGKWKLFSGISNKPANTVNFTGATYDTLYLGRVEAVGGVASTSNTSGTIVVTGGVGVSGRINAGGAIATTDTTASSSTTTGSIVASGGAGIAGSVNVGGDLTVSGTTTLSGSTVFNNYVKEEITVSATAASSTINYDIKTQTVLYYTSNASGNWTINVRGDGSTTLDSLMSIGQSLTLTFLATQGGSAYYASAFQVDGSSVTPKWSGGTTPSSGNANAIDAYTYTIIKTASNTFTVLASQVKYS